MFSIYKKELQSFFFTPFAYIITGLFMLMFTYIFNNNIGNMNTNVYAFSFTEIFYTVIGFFIYLIPIMTMRTYPDERKFSTEVLLMTSPANVTKIVLGKFLGLVTVFIFMLLGSTLFPIITAINGQVVASQLICAYIGFFCWGMMSIAVGMLVSCFTENSIIAAVMGEVAMLAIMFVDDFSATGFISQYPTVQKIIDAFAAQTRFVYFAQGVIRISDVVFFISAMVLFLAWNIIAIEKRRWNRG